MHVTLFTVSHRPDLEFLAFLSFFTHQPSRLSTLLSQGCHINRNKAGHGTRGNRYRNNTAITVVNNMMGISSHINRTLVYITMTSPFFVSRSLTSQPSVRATPYSYDLDNIIRTRLSVNERPLRRLTTRFQKWFALLTSGTQQDM